MQSIASTLPYYFSLIILIGIVWMVIQKVSTLTGLCKRQMVNEEEVNGSESYNEQTSSSVSQEIQSDISTNHFTPTTTSNVVFQVRNGSLVPSQTNLGGNQLLSSESFINQHGFCKSQLDVKMTSDTDNTMAEPNSTNYTSGEGKSDIFLMSILCLYISVLIS